jgi:hypothetical protein
MMRDCFEITGDGGNAVVFWDAVVCIQKAGPGCDVTLSTGKILQLRGVSYETLAVLCRGDVKALKGIAS